MMEFLTRNGVRMPHEKGATARLPIRVCPIPPTLIFPMRQHIGAPCEPCVKPGERVVRGQKVGAPQGVVSSPVLASTSGTVAAIERRPFPSGEAMLAVVVSSDGLDEDDAPLPPLRFSSSKEEILARLGDAGVVGMGGAGFPTQVKLAPPSDKHVDTLLINGAECEPYVTADHRLMLERAEAIMEGIRLAMNVLGVSRAIIGVEADKPDAIARLRKVAPGGVVVARLPSRYPQGGEKVLVKRLLGREVPAGGLPADAGCIVLNAGTAAAMADAVLRGLPLTERIVTVTGPGVARPANLLTRLGTPLRFALEQCGYVAAPEGTPVRLIAGGPMMGMQQPGDDAPIIKGTTGILALGAADSVPALNCISCGRCANACPARLMPMRLSAASRKGDIDLAGRLGALDCMECGSCTYSCPSKIDVLSPIRIAKKQVKSG